MPARFYTCHFAGCVSRPCGKTSKRFQSAGVHAADEKVKVVRDISLPWKQGIPDNSQDFLPTENLARKHIAEWLELTEAFKQPRPFFPSCLHCLRQTGMRGASFRMHVRCAMRACARKCMPKHSAKRWQEVKERSRQLQIVSYLSYFTSGRTLTRSLQKQWNGDWRAPKSEVAPTPPFLPVIVPPLLLILLSTLHPSSSLSAHPCLARASSHSGYGGSSQSGMWRHKKRCARIGSRISNFRSLRMTASELGVRCETVYLFTFSFLSFFFFSLFYYFFFLRLSSISASQSLPANFVAFIPAAFSGWEDGRWHGKPLIFRLDLSVSACVRALLTKMCSCGQETVGKR